MTASRRLAIREGRCCCAFLVVLVLGGCTSSLARRATVERRPLNYVGQVAFGMPRIDERRVVVPLTFSGGEWERDSAIATHRIESHVDGRTIEMTVLTSVADGEPAPQELRLGGTAPGSYAVVYRDPDGTRHPLGEIELPPHADSPN